MPSAIQTVSGTILSQPINDNFSYLNERKNDLGFSVKDNGATGQGVVYDTTEIQNTVTDALVNGGLILFPSGTYKISATITIDLTSYSSATAVNGLSVVGQGSANTEILVDGNFSAFTIVGGTASSEMLLDLNIGGMKITPTTGLQGTGLDIKIGSFLNIFDLMLQALDTGIVAEDFISSKLDRVRARFCRAGITLNVKNVFSNPNALDFYRCHFGNNAEYGIKILNGSNISFFGGSIEGNGITSTASTTFGMQIESSGSGGATGLNMYGVYFENNGGLADVRIVTGTNPATHVFSGCNFNRTNNTTYVPYNIRLDQAVSDGDVKIITVGCGFEGFNTYVADVARPYIKFFASANAELEQIGNYYGDTVERPAVYGGNVFARVKFNGTLASPTAIHGYNIDSIVKNTTGNYTINYKTISNSSNKIFNISLNAVGFSHLFSETSASITIATKDSTGTSADFSGISLVLYE